MSVVDFTDDMSLGEARALLRDLAMNGGAKCPCCSQLAKVYRRPIHSTMARSLIKMWRAGRREYVHVPTVAGDACEAGKLRYWNLVEEERQRRPDGGRSGWWRLTDQGEAWVRGHATVPKYAHVYDGRCLKLEGPDVTIEHALGEKFSYAQLMGLEDECKIEDTRLLASPAPVVSDESAALAAVGTAPRGLTMAAGSSETTALFDLPADPQSAIHGDWDRP